MTKDQKRVQEITDKVLAGCRAKFYNSMIDGPGWSAEVDPVENCKMSELLINEALPLLRKLADLPKLKEGDYR